MEKSPDAFRTISEVADDLDLPQHVLRFWETRFAQIKPLKRGGGRRYYRPDDVDLLKGIRHLLYGEGYTIKGVQRILKEDGIRFVQAIGRGEQSVEAPPAGAAPEEPVEDEGTAAVAAPARPGTTAAAPSPTGLAPSPDGRTLPMLPKADVARLKAVLDELLECERVLSTLTPPDSSDDELSRG
ncbi:MAG: MerR family transcriptional regulator [Microvirga sp.]